MLDYTGIAKSLADVIKTVPGIQHSGYEVSERDIVYSNMPLADVRPVSADPEIRAGQDYFTDVNYQVDIYAFSLNSTEEAATIRDSLLRQAQDAIRANPSWHVELESSRLGPTEFTSDKDEDTGTFVAQASAIVIAMAFTDRES